MFILKYTTPESKILTWEFDNNPHNMFFAEFFGTFILVAAILEIKDNSHPLRPLTQLELLAQIKQKEIES